MREEFRNLRATRIERAAIRTTLDALRAATEPVKVEAMQAIVEVWLGVKSAWCVQESASSHRAILVFIRLMNNGVGQ